MSGEQHASASWGKESLVCFQEEAGWAPEVPRKEKISCSSQEPNQNSSNVDPVAYSLFDWAAEVDCRELLQNASNSVNKIKPRSAVGWGGTVTAAVWWALPVPNPRPVMYWHGNCLKVRKERTPALACRQHRPRLIPLASSQHSGCCMYQVF